MNNKYYSKSKKKNYNLYNNELNDKKEKIKQNKFINLKSPLLKIIFSFLNEKKKLNIIINNKNIQKKLEVNINNYYQICEKIKIGNRNGKGKEYLNYKWKKKWNRKRI